MHPANQLTAGAAFNREWTRISRFAIPPVIGFQLIFRMLGLVFLHQHRRAYLLLPALVAHDPDQISAPEFEVFFHAQVIKLFEMNA
jgi:hypothetical protein